MATPLLSFISPTEQMRNVIRCPVQGHTPSTLRSQNSNPEIHVHRPVDSTPDRCLHVTLPQDGNFFKRSTPGVTFLLPLESDAAAEPSGPPSPAPFLSAPRIRDYAAAPGTSGPSPLGPELLTMV